MCRFTWDGYLIHSKCEDILKSLSSRESLSSAYLFYGQDGSGYDEAAELFVKRFLGKDTLINNPDVLIVTPEGTVKIDTIREIQKAIQYGPSQEKQFFVILHQAHALTLQAANAFLKTLEEPPANVSIILTSAQSASLIPTIHSRCQKLYFPSLQKSTFEPSTSYSQFVQFSEFEKLQLAQDLSTDKPHTLDTLNAWMAEIWGLDQGRSPQHYSHLEILADKIIDLGYNVNLRLQLESLFLKLN